MSLDTNFVSYLRVEKGTLLLAYRHKCSAWIVTSSFGSETTRCEDACSWGILLQGAVLIFFTLKTQWLLCNCLLFNHGWKDAVLLIYLARYLAERLSILVNLQSTLCFLDKRLFASYWISLVWYWKSFAFVDLVIVTIVFLNFGLA